LSSVLNVPALVSSLPMMSKNFKQFRKTVEKWLQNRPAIHGLNPVTI